MWELLYFTSFFFAASSTFYLFFSPELEETIGAGQGFKGTKYSLSTPLIWSCLNVAPYIVSPGWGVSQS